MAWPQVVQINEAWADGLTPLPRKCWGFIVLVIFQVPRLPQFGQGRTISSRASATDAFIDSGTCWSTTPTATVRSTGPIFR